MDVFSPERVNAALEEPSEYEGAALRFCGLYSTPKYREYTFTYTHRLGRAILYDGRMRHGAEEIFAGSRTNLVMWSYSSAYRRSPANKKNSRAKHRDDGKADPRCVSHHHDEDYCAYPSLPKPEGWCVNGRNAFKPAWRAMLEKDEYWKVQGTAVNTPKRPEL